MTMMQADVGPVLHMLDHVKGVLAPTSLEKFLLTHAYPYLRERIDRRFEHKGDDVVGDWEPLERSTMAIRIAQGFRPTPTNIRSGQMFRTIRQAREMRPMPTGAEVSIPGKSLPRGVAAKLRVAQRGGTAPNAVKDTPPRPVLGMNARDLAAVSTSFEKWLLGALA